VPAEPTPPIASPHPALEAMLTRPRLAGLTAAPDGSLLVVGVATPAPGATRYRSCLWAIDPDGADPARQLTRSAAGEALATFLSGGDLLFTSARPDPDAEEPPTDPPAALWRLPRTGGEAELLLAPSGGVRGIWTANDREVVVVAVDLHRDATTLEEDAEREKARRDAGVTARLYEPGEYPVRFWDRWLGPREPSLWVLDLTDDDVTDDGLSDDDRTDDPATRGRPRLLARGAALRDAEVALDAAGTTVVTTWARSGRRRSPEDLVSDLVAIDLVSGQRRVLVADGRAYAAPAVAPDGHRLVCVAADLGAPDRAPEQTLVLVPLAEDGTAETVRDLTPDWDRWPEAPRWSADGTAVLCTADDEGQAPVFRVDPRDGTVTRLTAEGAYAELCLPPSGPDPAVGYALRSTVGSAPRPVRLELGGSDQHPAPLPCPAGTDPDTRVERVVATAGDGAPVGSWLVLPADGDARDTAERPTAKGEDATGGADAPWPLVVLLHGGPLGSWNGWHWRWNPHVWAAEGYAVLLPDPALSTGYGRAFIERGWGRWGEAPYTDVMAAVEHVAARPDIDADRVAAAGGSFGGYLANWIAGQTDRFRAIVTHASLWSLPGFHGTTDVGLYWEREFGDPYLDDARYRDASPHHHVGRITTPMLVIHGEKDVRVPISEGVTLWTDLVRHGVEARLLYLPDEHHWVLTPQHARLWYETVLAFLAEHLRARPFERPGLV
jgi:dipeptidyl aminopeptidase/acylaminoacyl peptidase